MEDGSRRVGARRPVRGCCRDPRGRWQWARLSRGMRIWFRVCVAQLSVPHLFLRPFLAIHICILVPSGFSWDSKDCLAPGALPGPPPRNSWKIDLSSWDPAQHCRTFDRKGGSAWHRSRESLYHLTRPDESMHSSRETMFFLPHSRLLPRTSLPDSRIPGISNILPPMVGPVVQSRIQDGFPA